MHELVTTTQYSDLLVSTFVKSMRDTAMITKIKLIKRQITFFKTRQLVLDPIMEFSPNLLKKDPLFYF